ncbi:MAG: phosphatidylglycerophosphatase A [Elusimicrobia bacterium]|nr:phosphatidylglycerophosphatase A [Elusimicrobiota bacterium]
MSRGGGPISLPSADGPGGKITVWVAKFFATGAFLGYVPSLLSPSKKYTGAGFIGTAIGWALLPVLPASGLSQAGAITVACLAAAGAAHAAQKDFGTGDDPRIIIDETVGYFVSVAFLPRTLSVTLTAFVLFRALDTFKLPPIKAMEKLPGGLGIVGDDLAAGAAVNLILRLGRGVFGL